MAVSRQKKNANYFAAAGLLILINFISSVNDVLAFYVGHDINPNQIAFIRFLVTMISVLPFMLPKGSFYFKTKMPSMHMLRAIIGAVAIGSVTYSVVNIPLLKNTCIFFSEPIMFLLLASIFLKEKVDFARWGCTLLGFLGIIIITYEDFKTFNYWIWVPILGTFSFSLITLIARKMSEDEHMYTLLFYFGLGTSILFFFPAILVWKPLTWGQLGLLIFIGVNGNLMQVCMFHAFKFSDVSAFLPLRSTEMLFTFLFGYYIFNQVPGVATIVGGVVIAVGALLLTVLEKKKEIQERKGRLSQG
ncbi:MAG: DMT family transporter [Holosporales bacterium]|nr:DMT family transporter [Holosporales bacterium]